MAEPQKYPEKIGKYSVLERIGRGGMGFVYKAHDPILKRDVAIKTMLKDVADDEELRSRFLREAQSAGGLRHPNIVTIYDLGEDENGIPFIAMEFLSGTDLEHLIK
ncbi:MAG TPA: protein kinase, partial [Acidobacteriota bacterium]|nr:protein kinase [Acidobacteriota bacterium]